jgi:hypothetical protein
LVLHWRDVSQVIGTSLEKLILNIMGDVGRQLVADATFLNFQLSIEATNAAGCVFSATQPVHQWTQATVEVQGDHVMVNALSALNIAFEDLPFLLPEFDFSGQWVRAATTRGDSQLDELVM